MGFVIAIIFLLIIFLILDRMIDFNDFAEWLFKEKTKAELAVTLICWVLSDGTWIIFTFIHYLFSKRKEK